jgi:hypothetical protein
MIKLIVRVSMLAAILMAVTAVANAIPVTYFTTGCFGAACVQGSPVSLIVGAGTLTYTDKR